MIGQLLEPIEGQLLAQGALVEVDLLARCTRCKHYHEYVVLPSRLIQSMVEWNSKHRLEHGCEIEFITRQRRISKQIDDTLFQKRGEAPWWLDYKHNTDFKIAYVASATVTNAIESLASSTTLLAGYESASIDNSSNKYIELWLSGLVTVGTTPTVNTRIELHSVSQRADGTWVDVFDGTTGAESITSQGIKDGICFPIVFLNVDANTSNRPYDFTYRSLSALYNGLAPRISTVFTTHNTVAALNSTGGNHILTVTGAYLTGV